MNLLILDNYDSFVYNLAQLLAALGARPEVVRHDALTLSQIEQRAPQAIVISPGPGNPTDPAYFGVCADVIRTFGTRIPMLGVCLGHQGIAHVLGGRIVRAPEVMHGKTSCISHDESRLFEGLPQNFVAMRYHSLVVDEGHLPSCLHVTARTDDGTIMAFAHTSAALFGVQFHPESIGTPHGRQLLHNFLVIASASTYVLSK
jgi:anthranilate synthase/aminodeoxychorismate synthase-like glutamine amidotransferase